MRTVEWRDGKVAMIDQRALPHELIVVEYADYRQVAAAIRDMVVRGAPAIGVTAAMGLALAALQSSAAARPALLLDLNAASQELRASRPTAVNLSWALDRMLRRAADESLDQADAIRAALVAEAQAMADEDVEINQRMGAHGAALVHDGDTIIHHCNTGGLAAVDYGTALGVIRCAHEQGKRVHVFVDEADAFAPQRPLHGQERMLGAVEDIVRRGRIKGIGATLITQRSAVLNKNVLTQTEVLIALRTIAPQDQDAIDAWIQAHDVQEKRETMMASLASLPIGTAWYWSPGWLDIFKKVEVRERETFNSSATPKPGEVRRTPKTLADVDLSLLHTKIAATIEKAKQEDPRELRRRISGLEAELRKKAPAGAAAPAVRPAEDLKRRTNEAYDRGWKESAKEHERRQSILARSIRSVGHLAHQVRELAEKVDDVLAGLPETFTAYKFRGNPTPEIPQLKAEPKEVVWKARMPAIDAEFRSKVDPVPEGELRLTKAHHRILAALAQLHGIGVERPSKTQAALWAGYSPTSGGYYNYLGQLRSAGLVDYGGDATMFLTPEGRSAVESAPERPEIPGSVQDLQEQVFRMVGDSKTRILRALIEAYPRPMPKPELAERAGFSPTSGGYYNYLGTLRSMGLIDYVDGQAVATSVLFLEGSS